MARYKITTEDGKSYAVTTEDKPQGLLDRIKSNVSSTMSIPGIAGGPLSLPAKGYDLVNKLAGRAGERVATGLAGQGADFSPLGAPARPSGPLNPIAAAAIGTGVAMTPDIISSVGPMSEMDIAPKTAISPARRALGYSKAMLKTPFARGQAAQAAETALKENIIPGSGSPEVMMNRAQALKGKTGYQLGQMREAAGPQPIQNFLDDLESLRSDILKGKTGGVWDEIGKKIDYAKETIQGLSQKGDKVGLRDVLSAKKELGKTVNWLSDSLTQDTSKKIFSQLEKSMEKAVGSSGQDLGVYNSLKKLYGNSKSMIKALNNEIAAQEGNMSLSLPTHVIAAGQLASGRPIRALETAGLWELLKRRGAGMTAATLNKARVPLGAANPLMRAYQDNQ